MSKQSTVFRCSVLESAGVGGEGHYTGSRRPRADVEETRNNRNLKHHRNVQLAVCKGLLAA